MAFLDNNYLIGNAAGTTIFQAIKDLPVIDPHNHANVKEIADNSCYADAWQLFAATDHYVWEVLRKRNVPEDLITGKSTSPHDKFLAMAKVFPEIAGNPVYEWIHLDLKRYFGIDIQLCGKNGETIWNAVNEKLATDAYRPQALLTGPLNVEAMSSTDDPVELLEDHERANRSFGKTLIRPTWRPDKAMKIFAADWRAYIAKAGERFNMNISTLADLRDAMQRSHDYFAAHGCKATDHGIEIPLNVDGSFADADKIFRKALNGEALTAEETNCYMGVFLGMAAEMNAEKGWVTQLHAGAVRDVRRNIFDSLGPDAGGDVSNHYQDFLPGLVSFLNKFDSRLKTVLYCLDQGHQATLATLSRAFGSQVRLGSAWWLLDHPVGMKRQLEYIGSVDLWYDFAGMVSDSRKLLSYGSRFEMFRRVLADVLGEAVMLGRLPEDVALDLARAMAYSEPKQFWGL